LGGASLVDKHPVEHLFALFENNAVAGKLFRCDGGCSTPRGTDRRRRSACAKKEGGLTA